VDEDEDERGADDELLGTMKPGPLVEDAGVVEE